MLNNFMHRKVINKLVPQNHWLHVWLLDLCDSDKLFFNHFIEQKYDFIHFLCLVYLYKDQKLEYLEYSPKSLSAKIRTNSKKDILRELIHPYPDGLANILKKLGHTPYSKHKYFNLITLLHDNQANKFLSHASKITSITIKCLNLIEPDWRGLKLLHNVKSNHDIELVKYIQRASLKLSNKHPELFDTKSLHRLDNLNELKRWFKRRVNKTKFPPPPWAGNKYIRPILNGAELTKEKISFRNCIDEYLQYILLGTCYFYVSEYGPSIIKINKDPIFDWHIEDILGIENEKINRQQIKIIRNQFAYAGIYKQPQID